MSFRLRHNRGSAVLRNFPFGERGGGGTKQFFIKTEKMWDVKVCPKARNGRVFNDFD